ncbi:hypothetical protein ACO34A_23175 (plasmid) [Rhizobium sp. ACO-34A]|nr:hypothetical protein ACO34A_23175 [Rhizobium sp. ACO-34A]
MGRALRYGVKPELYALSTLISLIIFALVFGLPVSIRLKQRTMGSATASGGIDIFQLSRR